MIHCRPTVSNLTELWEYRLRTGLAPDISDMPPWRAQPMAVAERHIKEKTVHASDRSGVSYDHIRSSQAVIHATFFREYTEIDDVFDDLRPAASLTGLPGGGPVMGQSWRGVHASGACGRGCPVENRISTDTRN